MPRRSGSADSPIEELIDGLYALDPDRFTEERNAAAKRLRAEGDREGSDRVKALKKPTAVAWAVNQLPRRAPGLVDELLSAGDDLRRAQRAALSGSGRALREATTARRAAVARLVDEASAVFRDAGRSPASHVDAVRSTLEAASSDEETGQLVLAGRLTKEIEAPAGFGDITGFEVLLGGKGTPAKQADSARAGSSKPSAAQAAGSGSREQERAAAEASVAARRARERLEARVSRAEDAVMAARKQAAEARTASAATARDVDRLERELETARRRADRAEAAATKAESKHEAANRVLADAQSDLADQS